VPRRVSPECAVRASFRSAAIEDRRPSTARSHRAA
jgi:hypothetical protein